MLMRWRLSGKTQDIAPIRRNGYTELDTTPIPNLIAYKASLSIGQYTICSDPQNSQGYISGFVDMTENQSCRRFFDLFGILSIGCWPAGSVEHTYHLKILNWSFFNFCTCRVDNSREQPGACRDLGVVARLVEACTSLIQAVDQALEQEASSTHVGVDFFDKNWVLIRGVA